MDDKQQASIVSEGTALSIAFKSQPGQIILGSMIDRLGEMIDDLLTGNMTDDKLLVKLYEARAIVSVCGSMGDSINAAISLISRRSVASALRQKSINQEE
jgi:hypothetical protein